MLKNTYIILIFTFFSLFIPVFSMDESDKLITIQTNDGDEFKITPKVAQESNTLKHLLEDMEGDKAVISLPNISGPLFTNVLKAMEQLKKLNQNNNQQIDTEKLNTILATLNNKKPLSNNDLINFFCGVNYLNVEPLIEPSLNELSQRKLNGIDEWRNLNLLGDDEIRTLWKKYFAAKNIYYDFFCFKPFERVLLYSKIKDTILSKNGYYFVSLSNRKDSIEVRDLENWQDNPIVLKHDSVEDIIHSDDGKYLISSSNYSLKTTKIWDLTNLDARPVVLKNCKFDKFGKFIQSENSKYLISYAFSEVIKIWDIDKPSDSPIKFPDSCVEDVVLSNDGKYLISFSERFETIKIWDMENVNNKPIVFEDYIDGIIQSKNGKYFIFYSDRSAKMWEANSSNTDLIALENFKFDRFIFSEDDNYLISRSKKNGTIKVWSVKDPNGEPIVLEHNKVDDIIQRNNGDYLISRSKKDGTIKVWDMRNLNKPLAVLEHSKVDDIIQSDNGNYLVSSSLKKNNTVKVWNMENLIDDPFIFECTGAHSVRLNKTSNYLIVNYDTQSLKIYEIERCMNPERNYISLCLWFQSLNESDCFNFQNNEKEDLTSAYSNLHPVVKDHVEGFASKYIAIFIPFREKINVQLREKINVQQKHKKKIFAAAATLAFGYGLYRFLK